MRLTGHGVLKVQTPYDFYCDDLDGEKERESVKKDLGGVSRDVIECKK